jgi:pyruvate/2-oxoglutarate dehydrogenase complex dihydrolipoamide acyltransferase (E2) component
MLKHRHSDIGVAVAIKGGLIAPLLRSAETKGLRFRNHQTCPKIASYAARWNLGADSISSITFRTSDCSS